VSDPVPAITEAAATGEIAAIFADIRQVLGVDVVNLIWRHLATIDGALEWAWSTLRPLYVDGSVTVEATGLRAELALPSVPPVPAEVFAGLGMHRHDIAAIQDVLSAYDRTNAMALIALSALQASLTGQPKVGEKAPASPLPATQPRIALPRLPSLAELPMETAALVTALNGFGTRRPGAILASMYRHLAYWPPYLALTWLLLAPLDADGRLEAAIDVARREAQRRAERLLARLSGTPIAPPHPALASALAAAIEPFAGDVIAKMVVICALLRDVTPAGE
jgi:hypothetical protein